MGIARKGQYTSQRVTGCDRSLTRPFNHALQHVASNTVTRYKPVPGPQAFAANPYVIAQRLLLSYQLV